VVANQWVAAAQKEASDCIAAARLDAANKIRDARAAFEAEMWEAWDTVGAQL
jgi:hypothetical protein